MSENGSQVGPPAVHETSPGASDELGYRGAVEALTDPGALGDALTRHFLLVHPPSLSRRVVLPDGRGVAAVCRTSAGPLPLVVLRCRRDEDIPDLLAEVLDPVAKHYFITRPDYRGVLTASLRGVGDEEETLIHAFEPRSVRSSPRPATEPEPPLSDSLGEARLETLTRADPLTGTRLQSFRVMVGEREASSARVQWSSGGYAEIGVSTDPDFRRRGYARAATAALISHLADLGLTALYIADRLNSPSLALAASLSLGPSGDGEFACSGFKR